MLWKLSIIAIPAVVIWTYHDAKKDLEFCNLPQTNVPMSYGYEQGFERKIIIVPEQTEQKITKVEPAKKNPNLNLQVVGTNNKVSYRNLDVFCMAKNIYHEARGEGRIGMYSVAQVTINRVKHQNYPNTICEVVMQPFQFSWANDRSIRWTHPSGKQWEYSKKIAEKVIRDGYRVRGLENALFFHTDEVKPYWRDPNAKIAKVGAHIFYASAR
jgi:N-acetylmuramoyl-L-alanine amidase